MFIAYIAGGLTLGLIAGWFLGDIFEKNKLKKAKADAKRIIEEAKLKGEEVVRKADLDGKELLYKLRVDFEKQQ